ncbi:MFS transporter [Alsobacter sp. R-9]
MDRAPPSASASGDPGPPTARALPDVARVIGTIAIFQLGTGILGAVVPFRLGATETASLAGFVSSAYSVGFLAGCLAAPLFVARLGARPLLGVAALVSAAVALALWATPVGLAWGGLRAVAGFASGCYLTVTEAWLADRAPARHRGAAFSAYLTMSRTVFAAGQLSLAFGDPAGLVLFAAAAIAYLTGPLVASTVGQPPPPLGARRLGSLADVPLRVPVAAIAAALHGATTVTSVGLLPLWGLDRGLSVGSIATMLVAIQLTGLAFQIPLGVLSDRVGRKPVMASVAAAVAALSLAAPAAASLPSLLAVPLIGAWGGIAFVLYSLSAALMNDVARPEQRVTWSSSLLVVWGLGASVGPFATSLAMDAWGTGALFGVLGIANLALLPLLALPQRPSP